MIFLVYSPLTILGPLGMSCGVGYCTKWFLASCPPLVECQKRGLKGKRHSWVGPEPWKGGCPM